MAVRSKYSDLPGIDNQPDVFETPDVVEKSEQNSNLSEQNGDENVQLLQIDTNEAFERFSGKYLDSADVGELWFQTWFSLCSRWNCEV